MKNIKIVTGVLLGAVLIVLAFIIVPRLPSDGGGVVCTADAKLCPDGTYVARTGPKCEFAECPGAIEGVWKTKVDVKTGVSFQYPEHLVTQYIHDTDWPPQVQVLAKPFTCIEAGSEIAPAGKTEKRDIDGTSYCVTTESEGAAGSIYNQYAYAFDASGKTVIFTFTLRMVQCANYPEPEKTMCDSERASFSMDGILDRMAESFMFIK